MLSKKTTLALALMIVPMARECSYKETRGDNLVGVLSWDSVYGATAEELKSIYGTRVHDLAPGLRVQDDHEPWTDDPDENPTTIRLGGYHGIDTPKWYGHSSLYALSDEKYEEYYSELNDEEELAPLGWTISRLAQVIDWEEVWEDHDFSMASENVYLDDNGNTNRMMDGRPQRVIFLNDALAHHGLPSTDELFQLHTYQNEPTLLDLAEEFSTLCHTDPATLRSVGFTHAD